MRERGGGRDRHRERERQREGGREGERDQRDRQRSERETEITPRNSKYCGKNIHIQERVQREFIDRLGDCQAAEGFHFEHLIK